ncbi:hypothetical protein Q4494_04390 [Celeribacter halophilus]|uniref:Uncharacterized protein n=1 Tax=Celeribacter halophilus TaxID=576117 RepID=A0AAW7XTA0_9RHOB|nr:hypothetical protein [Celeribacter halophilus]MDO6456307.1 hypothetical protein [Celeribacter halophilus]
MTNVNEPNLWSSIWASFLALPTWVKLWVFLILTPVNLASALFLDQPWGMLIAALSYGGMAISGAVVLLHRGFSKLVSGGHVLPWTPLVLILLFVRPDGTDAFDSYLIILLVTNLVSLVFDYKDLLEWMRD